MIFVKKIIILCIIFVQGLFSNSATLNRYDTLGMAGPEGIDSIPCPWVSGKDLSFDFQISPYYTDAANCISVDGEAAGEKPLFEEGGAWNLPGIYYNLFSAMVDPSVPNTTPLVDVLPVGFVVNDASLASKTITSNPTLTKTSPLYYPSRLLINSLGGPTKFTTTGTKLEGVVENVLLAAFGGPATYNTATSGVGATRSDPSKRITSSALNLFYPGVQGFVAPNSITANKLPSQLASYKRQGVRFKASANVMPGVKAWVKGGVCQYKVKSNLFALYNKDQLASLPGVSGTDAEVLHYNLFTQDKLEEAFGAFDIDPTSVSNWSMEDTFAAVEFTTPITFMDNGVEGVPSEALRLWPTLTAGVWMPTSRKPDATKPYKLFDIPVSNQAHLGGTLSGSLSLEFQNYLFLSSGFSMSVFNTKTIDKYMLPTNLYHTGVSLDLFQVSKKPGKTYLGWVSLFAKNFFEKWTAHAQYSITNHLADEITVLDPVKARVFDSVEQPGAMTAFRRHISQTAWSVHEFQAGLVLALSQNLELAGSFRLVGMGENVPKTKTIMASFKLVF